MTDVDQNGEKVVFIASMAVIDALCKAKYSPLSCLYVCLSVCIPSYLSVCPSVPLHASWNNQLQKIYPELFRISYQIDFITCVIGEILFRLNKPLLFISVEHAYVSMWILFLSHNVFKSVRYLYTLVLHPLPDIVHMVYAMWE